MVGNVSWGGDTLMEGVEHLEGSGECIRVLAAIEVTVQSATG